MSKLPEPTRRPLWRRLLRWCGWSIAGVFALCLLLIAALVLINWQDEPLTPEAQAWLVVPENPVPDAENAWLAMIAIGVEKQPGTAVGRQMLERLSKKQPSSGETTVPEEAGSQCAAITTVDTAFCNIREQGAGLLGRIEAREKELLPVLKANQAALARYDAATRLPGFFDEQLPDAFASPPLSPAPKVACLTRSELALRLLRGEQEAEARFVRHAHYWLTALRQSHNLIGATIANVQVQADLDLLRGLGERNPALGARLRQALRPDLQALASADVRTIRERWLPAELRFMDQVFSDEYLRDSWKWYDRALIRHHASLNFRQRLLSHPEEIKARCDGFWHYVYNPLGKIMACASADSGGYDEYIVQIRATQDAAARPLASKP